MKFDCLCQLAEQGLLNESIARLIETARIFEFPGRAHDVLPKVDFNGDGRKVIEELFFLPFRVIAVEDTASVIMLADYQDDALGLNEPRFWLECQIVDCRLADQFHKPGRLEDIPAQYRGCAVITWGKILSAKCCDMAPSAEAISSQAALVEGKSAGGPLRRLWDRLCGRKTPLASELPLPQPTATSSSPSKDFRIDASILPLGARMFKPRRREKRKWDLCCSYTPDEAVRICEGMAKNVLIALQQTAMYNLPGRFIVEKTPVTPSSRPKDLGRILPSTLRPHYILLEPREFRERIGLGEPHAGQGGKTTHERRAHLRFLKNERFTQGKRDTWIRVRATIVGPKEGTSPNGKWRYRILDDR